MQSQHKQHSTPSSENLKRAKRQARSYLFSAAIAWSLSFVVLAGALFIGLYAWDQRQVALTRQSEQLAGASQAALEEGDATRATLLALEALPDPDQTHLSKRPMVPAAEGALYAAVSNMTERRKYEGHLDHGGGEHARYMVLKDGDTTLKIVDVFDDEVLSTIDVRSEELLSVSLSYEGTQVAALYSDGQLDVWNAQTGEQVSTTTLDTRSERVRIRFLPGNELISVEEYRTGQHKQRARIYDLKALSFLDLRPQLAEIDDIDIDLTFEVPGLVFARGREGLFAVIDANTRQVVLAEQIGSERHSAITLSDDHRLLAVAGTSYTYRMVKNDDGTEEEEEIIEPTIVVINVSKRSIVSRLKGHANKIRSVDFDRAGKQLASVAAGRFQSGHIIIWDVSSGESKYQRIINAVGSRVKARFVNGGSSIAIFGSRYGAIWDRKLTQPGRYLPTAISSRGLMAEWPGSPQTFLVKDREGITFHARRFRNDNVRVASEKLRDVEIFDDVGRAALYGSSSDVVLLTTKTGAVIQKLGGHTNGVHHVHHFGDDGGTLTFSRGGDVRLWRNHPRTAGARIGDTAPQEYGRLSTSPDGKQILHTYFSQDPWGPRIQIYPLNETESETNPILAPVNLRIPQFGNNGQVYGYYRAEKQVVRWNPSDGSETILLEADKVGLSGVMDISPTAQADTVLLRVFDREARGPRVLLTNPDDRSDPRPFIVQPRTGLGSFAFAKDARLIAAADEESIVVWDVIERRSVFSSPIGDLDEETPSVLRSQTVSISKEGDYVALFKMGGVRVWSTETGELVRSAQKKFGNGYGRQMAFLNDTELVIAFRRRDGLPGVQLLRWNWKTDEVVQNYPVTGKRVSDLSNAPGEDYLMAKEDRNTAVMWDVESGAVLRRWYNAQQIEFSPTGDSVICLCANELTLYPFLPRGDALIDLARENLPPHRNALSDEERRAHGLAPPL